MLITGESLIGMLGLLALLNADKGDVSPSVAICSISLELKETSESFKQMELIDR